MGRQAVVIGAGMAGLAAAGALADHFQHVRVLERDELPPAADHRAGTPQSRHVHGLLAGGLQALVELFPGFEQALLQAGAVPLRTALDVRLERPGFDPFPARDLGMLTYAASRPVIEFTLRQCLLRRANVVLQERCRVIDIAWDAAERTVSGVHCLDAMGRHAAWPAELVVDASGRGLPTLALLQAAGCPAVPQTCIGVDIGYASAAYELRADASREWKGVMTLAKVPHSSRAALMLPLEGARCILTVTGRGGDKPPGDEAGFLEFVRQLRTLTIYNALQGAQRVGEISRHVFRESVRRHFHQVQAFPRGVLPVGDALCLLNPAYGQGMSVAAQEALLLRSLLVRSIGRRDGLSTLAPAFFAQAAPVLDTAWTMASIPDFLFPQTTGEPPPDLKQRLKFGAALMRLAARDPGVHQLTAQVQHLLKPDSVYRQPIVMARVLMEAVRASWR
jgi:2-polyprenyl-6-methoxyphenol hydroxylase-like FAD-dependent oxidoreductase